MPTAAVAIPMRTSAPDLTRSAAHTLSAAPTLTGVARGAVPSALPPPSLPPGPPSSVSSGYTATRAGDGRQWLETSGEALAAPPSAPGASSGTETEQELVTDALLAEVLGDEEILFELQTMLNATDERPVAQEPNQGSQGAIAAPTNSIEWSTVRSSSA